MSADVNVEIGNRVHAAMWRARVTQKQLARREIRPAVLAAGTIAA